MFIGSVKPGLLPETNLHALGLLANNIEWQFPCDKKKSIVNNKSTKCEDRNMGGITLASNLILVQQKRSQTDEVAKLIG